MAKSASERQRDFRIKQGQQIARAAKLEAAMRSALKIIEGKTGDAANAVRAALEEGLAG